MTKSEAHPPATPRTMPLHREQRAEPGAAAKSASAPQITSRGTADAANGHRIECPGKHGQLAVHFAHPDGAARPAQEHDRLPTDPG